MESKIFLLVASDLSYMEEKDPIDNESPLLKKEPDHLTQNKNENDDEIIVDSLSAPEESEEEMEEESEEEMEEESEEEMEEESEEEMEEESEDVLKKELMEFAEMDEFQDLSPEELLDIQEALSENINAQDEFAEEDIIDKEIPNGLEEILNRQDTSESPQSLELESSKTAEEPESFTPEIDADLEAKMKAELAEKQKAEEEDRTTKEEFIEYLGQKRAKIIYHALWYLLFNIEDHQASKKILYDALKEVTSKDPVEPLEEHKFYFGLGFILRLKYNNQKVVKFHKGKLKVIGNVKELQKICKLVGDPISERPILTTREKEKMFRDFLNDDFNDI